MRPCIIASFFNVNAFPFSMSTDKVFTREDVADAASSIRVLLTGLGVQSREALEELMTRASIKTEGDGQIQIAFRPSEKGSQAHTLSYVVPDRGIPLEVRMNFIWGYTYIILKANEQLPGYAPFEIGTFDDFGNTRQSKELPDVEFSTFMSELESLMGYKQ